VRRQRLAIDHRRVAQGDIRSRPRLPSLSARAPGAAGERLDDLLRWHRHEPSRCLRRQIESSEQQFRGFGRSATDDKGEFRFHTVKPGRVPGPGGQLQAPHILAVVFMRGQLKQLVSRIYFPDEPANAKDAVLALVPKERRATLIARKTGKPGVLEWNVILQGRNETVFFDC